MATAGSLNIVLSATADQFGRDMKKASQSVTGFASVFAKGGIAGAGMAAGFAAARSATSRWTASRSARSSSRWK
jgi:hypothetical protein